MKATLKKIVATIVSFMFVACLPLCLTACNVGNKLNSARLQVLADDFTLMLLGNDALSWNVFSVTPEQSYGYVKTTDYTWYSYQSATEEDLKEVGDLFNLLYRELEQIDFSKLSGNEPTTYRYLESTLRSYMSLYNSPYAEDFELIGGSYINSEGGYVADFASSVENYAFRNENDVKNLLEITKSTNTAFLTYLDYAEDRAEADYPLYDVTLNGMQAYLNGVAEQGTDYYLYGFIQNKINETSFLSAAKKEQYNRDYTAALNANFMTGVKALSAGLDEFKGNVTETEASYLAVYGNVGEAYYQWSFENKTGIQNADIDDVYDELYAVYSDSYDDMQAILQSVRAMETTNPALYADFNAYLNGEKALLNLTEPDQMLTYLKTAAKSIVPDLQNEPAIDFKYMDDTVAEISTAAAYYLKSPADQQNAPEHITLNPNATDRDPTYLLVTIAHEGYPGHLYAYVNAKEAGANLFVLCNGNLAFSEGWAMYVELVLLDHIAANSTDNAVKMFCNFYSSYLKVSYINAALYDLQFNYFGDSVQDLVGLGMDEAEAREELESYMENPAVYIPYGYGMAVMVDIHDTVKTALGNNYNEVEFNKALLSEGMGPTVTRAYEIAEEFIASKG